MNTQTALQDFDRYLRARYPIIAILSHEENRVENELVSLLKGRKRNLYTWTYSNGMIFHAMPGFPAQPYMVDSQNTVDPAAALRVAIEYPSDTDLATVFIFKDLHKYFNDPLVIRLLRDLCNVYEGGKNTLVLLSPEMATPGDLEKNMVTMQWPVPDADEIGRILNSFEANLDPRIAVTLNGERDLVIDALRGLTAFEILSVLGAAVIATGRLGDEVIPYIIHEKKAIIAKSGALEFFEGGETMDFVGGLPGLKEYAATKMDAMKPEAREFGVEPPKGCVLLGVPGAGKSLSVKAIAHGMPLLRLDIGAVMGGLVGASEANIRQALATSEAVAPCVLWIDEMDKALGEQGGESDGGTTLRVKGTILTWMQEKKAPVYVCATANDVSHLKPELLRRFDDVLYVDLPNHFDRVEVLAIHIGKRGRNPEAYDLDTIADVCWGFTGAELEKVVKSALEKAFRERVELSQDHLMAAAKTVVPISATMKESIDNLRAWATGRTVPAADPLEEKPVVKQHGAKRQLEM